MCLNFVFLIIYNFDLLQSARLDFTKLIAQRDAVTVPSPLRTVTETLERVPKSCVREDTNLQTANMVCHNCLLHERIIMFLSSINTLIRPF
jgi:hypothetical protein